MEWMLNRLMFCRKTMLSCSRNCDDEYPPPLSGSPKPIFVSRERARVFPFPNPLFHPFTAKSEGTLWATKKGSKTERWGVGLGWVGEYCRGR